VGTATAAPEARPKLTDLVSPETLTALQEQLAALTGVSVVVRDADGERITSDAAANPFCRLVARAGTGNGDCLAGLTERLAASGGDGVAEGRCRGGLVHLSAPILANSRVLGSVVLGDRPSAPIGERELLRLAGEHGLNESELRQAAGDLPVWTARQRQTARRFLRLTADTLSRLCSQEEELRARVEELWVISSVAGMVAEMRDLQAILDTTARRVAEVMRVHACSIRLLDAATGELRIRAVHNLSTEYLNKGPIIARENPIDAAALAGQTVYVADMPGDPRTRYPDEARQEGLASSLVTGMIYRGKPLGVICVYTNRPYRFSSFEATILRAIAAQAAVAIANSRLFAEAQEAQADARQLRYAGEIQRRMIPAQPPAHPHLEFGCVYCPSLDLGGDFYDLIELPDGNLGLAICDVVGHGVPASLLMASIRGALRAYSHSIYDLDEIVEQVSRALSRDSRTNEFASLFYGVFSADGRRLTYCNAGHEPPLLLREGRVELLEVCGPVIGVMPGERFDKAILHLRPEDRLLLYTDGAVEALDFNDRAYGRGRLQKAFVDYSGLPTHLIARQIHWDVKRYMGLSGQTDDITLVAARIK